MWQKGHRSFVIRPYMVFNGFLASEKVEPKACNLGQLAGEEHALPLFSHRYQDNMQVRLRGVLVVAVLCILRQT